MKLFKPSDPWASVVIVLTVALFSCSLAVKGITHELFLETGVFLVSVKLILMAGKNAATEKRLELHLRQIKELLAGNGSLAVIEKRSRRAIPLRESVKLSKNRERKTMKKILGVITLLAIIALPVFGQEKEQSRVANAGQVMKEVLNIPDDIPQSVIDKADCVVVLPSVLKFAFGFGGSYRKGRHDLPGWRRLQRPLGRSDHDGPRRRKLWTPDRRAGDGFRAAADEPPFGAQHSVEQSKTGRTYFRCRRSRSDAICQRKPTWPCEPKIFRTPARADSLPESLFPARPFAPITEPTRSCMEEASARTTSCSTTRL